MLCTNILWGDISGPKTTHVDQSIFSNWVINSIKTLMVQINLWGISTININACLPFFNFLDHFIIEGFIFGLGNFDLACVGLKAV